MTDRASACAGSSSPRCRHARISPHTCAICRAGGPIFDVPEEAPEDDAAAAAEAATEEGGGADAFTSHSSSDCSSIFLRKLRDDADASQKLVTHSSNPPQLLRDYQKANENLETLKPTTRVCVFLLVLLFCLEFVPEFLFLGEERREFAEFLLVESSQQQQQLQAFEEIVLGLGGRALMEVALLPLPTSLRAKLFAAGHFTTTTLLFLTPLELAREAQLSNEEALSVLKLVPRSSSSSSSDGIISASSALDGAKTAWDLLEYEKNRKKIVTSCAELDMILEGGFCPKEVTEICGVPGVGKTQLGMQLAINVQIPVKLGGVGGHAIYIDTEGSFMLERALQMTKASIEELVLASSLSSPMDDDLIQQLDIDTYLSHIYLLRVHDPTEQLAVINNLPNLLKEHNQVKLIVIDSITFNFRQDFEDMAGRTRLLAEMGQKLGKIAEEHDLAIVLTNQVTMKPSNNEISRIVPALGESWSHACTNRVMMYWIDTQRYAHVVKSPSLQAATAAYDINEGGICSAKNKSNNKSNNNDNNSNNKRLKLDEEAAAADKQQQQ